MSDKAVVTQTTLDAIGQAIITKGGATAAMVPGDMASAILSIPSGDGMPDIKKILDDDEEDYSHKIIVLIANNHPSNTFINGARYRWSDSDELTTSGTHSWDASKDIDGKWRWVIVYNNTGNFDFDARINLPNENSVDLVWIHFKNGLTFSATNYGFGSLFALKRVTGHATLNMGSQYKRNQWFSNSNALEEIDPNLVSDGVVSSQGIFPNYSSIKILPESIDLSSMTTWIEIFSGLRNLKILPSSSKFASGLTISFANCICIERDSFAKFTDGSITGGFVFGLNTVEGGTLTLNGFIRSKFTAPSTVPDGTSEQEKIEAALNAKGWTLAW